MTNTELVCIAAVESGFYTAEEVEELLSMGMLPEMHVASVWRSQGYFPKRGSHGFECKLWKKRERKEDVEETDESEKTINNSDFILVTSFLFHRSQVEKIEKS